MALTDNISAYWKLEDLTDSTATETDLTNNAVVTFIAGKIANAAHFVAASLQFLSHADDANLSTGNIDFTLNFWTKLTDKNLSYALITKAGDSGAGRDGDYDIYYIGGATDRFEFSTFTAAGAIVGRQDANTFGSPSAGTYYMVTCIHSGTNTKIAVNAGTQDSAADSGTIADSTKTFRIGASDNGTFYLNGDIDEVGFWKRALTAAEITQLYNNGAGLSYPFPTGVVDLSYNFLM